MRRAAILLALLALACPAAATASSGQTSIFQDDARLVYGSPQTVQGTLSTLADLGVEEVRVTLKWADVAPAISSRRAPAGFNAGNRIAADPAAYPPGAWSPYDRLVRDADRAGIAVLFNVTAPGPLWAMAAHPPEARAANHYTPNAQEFGSFVHAAGVRYSGGYAGLPRVSHWSIWNEPNQPGWLAPQWRRVKHGWVPNSPRLLRQLAGAAYRGLADTGHLRDTILIGETAPTGYAAHGALVAMKPLPFIRALYCLDGRFHSLRGASASALGCPTRGSSQSFVSRNSPLFAATGFAHHPYSSSLAPDVATHDPDTAPLANLDRLERTLDHAFAAYRVRRQIPIYLTEFGYQTNPPNPHIKISPAQQAAYLNTADHLAWRDRRVRSVAQFLLRDSGPDSRYQPNQYGYWDTFQSGLEYADGRSKPALEAYRLPLWVSGRSVWGQVRPAARLGAQSVQLQWRAVTGGSFRTLRTVRTSPAGFLQTSVAPPRAGVLRLVWRHFASRLVAVR